ncbi:MAG: hypothetical protein H8E46_00795 [FCB group bacterium]|nr:hypothetical protein [FCB group bacterium]
MKKTGFLLAIFLITAVSLSGCTVHHHHYHGRVRPRVVKRVVYKHYCNVCYVGFNTGPHKCRQHNHHRGPFNRHHHHPW